MSLLVALFLLACVPAVGIIVIKKIDQRHRDRQRKTYKLHFPRDLSDAAVVSWIRAVSGTLRARHGRLTGVPTIAFEMWATSTGIQHRIKVPWQHADFIVAQLRSLVPGIRLTPEDEFPRRLWTRAVEVGLTHSSRQLRIFSAADTATTLLASVQALEGDESLLLQWIMTPAVPTQLPVHKEARTHHTSPRVLVTGTLANRDEVKDRRDKLGEPNVQAILRVAAVADTKARADHLLTRVRAALASTRSASVRFTKRRVGMKTLQERIDRTSAPVFFPMQLAAPEIAALLAWPIGNPFVSGLPPVLSRQLPASDQVPKEGKVIGRSNFPGNERKVAIAPEEGRKHMHVVGPTGSGKTVLLANMMRQDIEAGHGVILIENKGDLFDRAVDYVPWGRIEDTIILNVQDTKHPVGFNILSEGDPMVVVDEIVALFEHLYKDSRSVWTREVLYHALRTLVTHPDFTFVDLAPLLVPMTTDEIGWTDQVIRSLKDRELRNFWQRFHNQPRAAQDRITQPVMDRIWQLNARPEIRNIIGQSKSAFRMADVIKDNKILLVNLKGLPRDTASLMGTLLMNAIWHAVKSNLSQTPTFLYLDEFQDFVNLPIEPGDMLAKARGFGLGMTLAHQYLSQLPRELAEAVSANARTKIVFQTSASDAKTFASEFGSSVTTDDFTNLGQYEAIARISTGLGISPPLTFASSEPAPGYQFGREVKARSQRLHGRDATEVEQEIASRRTIAKAPKAKRPAIGSDQAAFEHPPTN